MRLLLDECVPRPLLRDLKGFDATHVTDAGWSGRRNGALIQLMVGAKFDTLLTVDRGIEFQQNVVASGIGVVVVLTPANRLKELRALLPQTRDGLSRVSAGHLIKVGDS